MKIKKQEFQVFKELFRSYLKAEREITSKQLVDRLKSSRPELYIAITKTVGKGNVQRYIGSSLLRSVQKEGWLTYGKGLWKAKAEWGFCTYCFESLEDVYVIDIDHNQFCDGDCFDEYETVHHYDSYVDDYMFLFWDFQKLKERYSFYMERPLQISFETHLDLTIVERDIYEVLNDDCFSTVFLNGGDDGPVAAEMYRMLMVLSEEVKVIEDLIQRCKQRLPETNELFSIEVDQDVVRKRNKPEMLRDFIRTHRKFRDKEQRNKWVTIDSSERSNWYSLLTKCEELEGKIKYRNEIKCPSCEEEVEQKWSRRMIDGFLYCDECYKD